MRQFTLFITASLLVTLVLSACQPIALDNAEAVAENNAINNATNNEESNTETEADGTTEESQPIEGQTIASGLNGPQGVLVDPDGTVWIADSGIGGEQELPLFSQQSDKVEIGRFGQTAQIVKVEPDGTQSDVAILPSILSGQEFIGGARLALLDGTLYATVGWWTTENGPDRLPNFASIVQIVEGEVTELVSTWDIENEENPGGFIIDSHPYGLIVGPDDKLWVADAGGNDLLRVDPSTGEIEVIAVLDGLPGPFPNSSRDGAMELDPVPTAIAFDEVGNSYISLLPGFPPLPGSAKVLRMTPDGEISDYATGLTMLTDLRMGPDGNLYAIQFGMFTQEGPQPNAGAIIRVKEGDMSEIVVGGLSFPTSIDFNEEGDAYVTINSVGAPGSGEVVMFAGLTAMSGQPIEQPSR